MATETPAPPVRATVQACPSCGAPLDDTQRYCLNCGRRVADGRDDLLHGLAASRYAPPPPAVVPPEPWWRSTPPAAVAAAVIALLGAGLFGAAVSGDEAPPAMVRVAAPQAPDVNVSVPAGGAATGTASNVEFTGDWTGEDGWTVQLEALPKDGTTPDQVAAAKTSAEGKGAEDVGALDSDEYPSLDPGEYVVYSGVYKAKKRATKALKGLKKDFPDAKVVEVSAGGGAGGDAPKVDADADKASDAELDALQDATGDDYVKKARKLPDKVATQGKAPKKDNGKAGGGSKSTVIE